jgi:hypothetical protein
VGRHFAVDDMEVRTTNTAGKNLDEQLSRGWTGEIPLDGM